MARKMLIDAAHAEEQRVAIIDEGRLDSFETETSTKKQLKGNIYLAKVIRVEPSLQAAFVDFGNDRHGFLPFSEIHPDYYHIPVGDRVHLEKGKFSDPKELDEEKGEADSLSQKDKETDQNPLSHTPFVSIDVSQDDPLLEEETFTERPKLYPYKIQEVIKRRQIVLIQVVKEERGNKGAALTTYLSLPGRYCILMPNSDHHQGGISRKITDAQDRHRLREILEDLSLPQGINLIVRTAGQDRNKLEIKRDFDYLLRLWGDIREKTLQSVAPKLIYAEGDLIKRTLRDYYNKDIDDIIVEGEDAYKQAKVFMKTLLPSHVRKIKLYKDPIPLFRSYGVEDHIDAIMTPTASLPSGGSIVINPTEALVAIDVNSGKFIKERHIDETALKTNLEAADEVGRQMRLRDLGGLVVIDFIDMQDNKHIQAVEKRLREACHRDRARIQIGRISQFGLLELSRQRLRPSIVDVNMTPCLHCKGAGVIRSIDSIALHILREIESVGIEGQDSEIMVIVPEDVDLYLLNQKRAILINLENKYQFSIHIQRDKHIAIPDFRIQSTSKKTNDPSSIEQTLDLPVVSRDSSSLEEKGEALTSISDTPPKSPDSPPLQKRKRTSRHGLFNSRRQGNFKKNMKEDPSLSPPLEGNTPPASDIIETPLPPKDLINGEEKTPAPPRPFKKRYHRPQPKPNHQGGEIPLENPPPREENLQGSPPPETPVTRKKRGWWKRLLDS